MDGIWIADFSTNIADWLMLFYKKLNKLVILDEY